jgi:hypothetical protein
MGLFVGNHLVSPVEIKEVEKSSRKYQLLDRVTDDSNNEIGTVGTFFTDANGVEYAVVVLDAKDRSASTQWSSTANTVTDLPSLNRAVSLFSNKNTATFNTQKILDWCATNNYTSTACSHCRNKSYVLDGITYYGQLPNIYELYTLLANYVSIDTLDNTSGYKLVNLLQNYIWASSQYGTETAWCINSYGNINTDNKAATGYGVIPVLEIPNT